MLHHRQNVGVQKPSFVPAEAAYVVDQIHRINSRVVAATMVGLDLFGCVALCSAVGHGSALPLTSLPGSVIAWLAMPIMLWLACAYATGLYNQNALRAGSLQLVPALATACLAFLPSLSGGGIAGVGGKVLSPALFAFLGQVTIVVFLRCAWGFFLGGLLRRGFCLERVVVLASSFPEARVLAAAAEQRTERKLGVALSAATPRLGDNSGLLWLKTALSSQSIDRILLAEDVSDPQRLHEMVLAADSDHAKITVVPKSGPAYCLGGKISDLPRLDELAPPLSTRQLFIKRFFDICVSGAVLLAIFPLLLFVAALIRLDSKGPILFRQNRQGLNGILFEIVKFRTMHGHLADPGGLAQTKRGDVRVTRVGRLLRSTSLDELPQLVNVLCGNMSIIGPRPHALGMIVGGKPVAGAVEGYESRLRIKPGITGWAQVNGSRGEVRAEKALRQRVALDCYYIENWSLMTDVRILCRTVTLIFYDERAF